MSQREIVKKIALIAAITAASAAITRTLSVKIPATNRMKAAEMIGSLGGWMLGEMAQPVMDKAVDAAFDRRELKKSA